MIRRPPRSTQSRSSAASDVYKRQIMYLRCLVKMKHHISYFYNALFQSDMAKYRPITNLSTISKILEKLALRRLRLHVMSTGNFSEFQSAYRGGHSTKTALLKVINDVVMSTCDRSTTVLLSLDISAAFDTIDHSILLDRTSFDFGIHGSALSWLRSFVIDLHQYVAVSAQKSSPVNCISGVPQGSVLGPLLFAMYVSPISNVIAVHSPRHHQYAAIRGRSTLC